MKALLRLFFPIAAIVSFVAVILLSYHYEPIFLSAEYEAKDAVRTRVADIKGKTIFVSEGEELILKIMRVYLPAIIAGSIVVVLISSVILKDQSRRNS